MIRFIARLLPNEMRIRIAMNFLIESALVQPGRSIELKLEVYDAAAGDVGVTCTGPQSWEAKLGEQKEND